jgi:5-methylcytosine-specific restriction protein A
MFNFRIGQVFVRQQDLHDIYGGQRQGGISTPARYPAIFLFTGESGAEYGYDDKFQRDGTFWYTGEGQVGDMELTRGNLALRNQGIDQKQVFLFQDLGRAKVQFVGEAFYLGHHTEDRIDSEKNLRKAIVFELGLECPIQYGNPTVVREAITANLPRLAKRDSLRELRQLAIERSTQSTDVSYQRRHVYIRSEAVRRYVLGRAGGRCEGCRNEAPFKDRKGQPYLEPHHTARLADGGPDHPAFVIALCPNCHRRVHHAKDGKAYNQELVGRLTLIEAKGASGDG